MFNGVQYDEQNSNKKLQGEKTIHKFHLQLKEKHKEKRKWNYIFLGQ